MSGVLCAIAGTGGGGDTNITLNSASVSSTGAGTRTATYRIGNDSKIYHGDNGSFSLSYIWCDLPAVPGEYEARATVTGGALTSGTEDTWLPLDTTRDWTVQDTVSAGGESVDATMTIQIRNATTETIVDGGTISMSANRTS